MAPIEPILLALARINFDVFDRGQCPSRGSRMRSIPIEHGPTTLPRLPALSPMGTAALTIGSLDLAACALYWAMHGIPPARVAQAAGSWLVGASAFSSGALGTVLGLLVIYALAALDVAGYRWLASRESRLLRAPLFWGPAYGACLFALLTWVLVPLSAAPPHSMNVEWMLVLLGIYMFLIGMPCALFARRMALHRFTPTE